jgi:hypothetical protein
MKKVSTAEAKQIRNFSEQKLTIWAGFGRLGREKQLITNQNQEEIT